MHLNPSGEVEETETTTTTASEIKAAEVVKSKKIISSKVENMRIRACVLMNTRGSPGLQVHYYY